MAGSKKKRKRVPVRLAKRQHVGKTTEPYKLMDEIMAERRLDLKKVGVKIGIAWHSGWRPDADGHLQLGNCSKRQDLERELNNYDFIISLNEKVWPHLNSGQKYRLVWHELCHAELKYDSDGSVLKDDRDRIVCRIRAHDIQEFKELAGAYGTDEDFNATGKAALNDAQRPLFNQAGKEAKPDQKTTNNKRSTKKQRTVASMQKTVTATESGAANSK